MTRILVLYYSRHGSVRRMADLVARGVASVPGCEAVVRTVPEVSPAPEACAPAIPESGPPYADLDDLRHCDGLILGSPTRFGHMARAMSWVVDTRRVSLASAARRMAVGMVSFVLCPILT